MIKIAVFNLGKGMYSAFSLNQEYPLATVLKAPLASKEEIERILTVRFHSQRNEYKKMGKDIEPINSNGKRRGGWKYIWTSMDIFYNKPEKTVREEVLVNETGLSIVKKTPLVEAMEKALEPTKESFVMAEYDNGKFSFTPLTEDIIAMSQIPEYIKQHNGGNND